MAGLIMTAKAFQNKLNKAKKAAWKDIQAFQDMGVDPGYTMDDVEEREIQRIAEEFRLQCRLAVKLRDIAIEEGLIKKNNGTPMLEDSPVLADRYAMITIRPVDGTCLVYFEQAVAGYLERPWVLGAEYHFEQTGDASEAMGDGFHVHIVAKCKSSIRVSEITRHAAMDFDCKHSIQIGNDRNKFLKTERDLEYALNYIRGNKHSDEKEAAVELNTTWRELNGLQDAYYVRDWDNRESRPDAVIIEEIVD